MRNLSVTDTLQTNGEIERSEYSSKISTAQFLPKLSVSSQPVHISSGCNHHDQHPRHPSSPKRTNRHLDRNSDQGAAATAPPGGAAQHFEPELCQPHPRKKLQGQFSHFESTDAKMPSRSQGSMCGVLRASINTCSCNIVHKTHS